MSSIAKYILLEPETFFLLRSIVTRNNHREEKGIISIGLLVLFGLLLGTGIFEWSFRYAALLFVLVIQAIEGTIILIGKREKEYRLRKNTLRFVSNCFIFTFALFLAILCPQYERPETTGTYEAATAKYALS